MLLVPSSAVLGVARAGWLASSGRKKKYLLVLGWWPGVVVAGWLLLGVGGGDVGQQLVNGLLTWRRPSLRRARGRAMARRWWC